MRAVWLRGGRTRLTGAWNRHTPQCRQEGERHLWPSCPRSSSCSLTPRAWKQRVVQGGFGNVFASVRHCVAPGRYGAGLLGTVSRFNVAIAMHADAHAAATCRCKIMGVGHGDSFLLCKSTQRLSTQKRGTITNDYHPDIIIQMTGIHRTIPS